MAQAGRQALSPRGAHHWAGGRVGGGEGGVGANRARPPAGVPRYPLRALPISLCGGETPAAAPWLRTRLAPAVHREETSPQTAGNVEWLRDPRPATPGWLTHRPSSCSASFTLKLSPQHPTLPAPPLTHFPAEPAHSITPAPPPPSPPQAWPRPGAEGACGSCRRDRGKGSERRWTAFLRPRAVHCGGCSSALEGKSALKRKVWTQGFLYFAKKGTRIHRLRRSVSRHS